MYKGSRLIFYLLIIFSGIILCAVIGSADMIPINPSPPHPSFIGFVETALLNYPINLMFLAMFSLLLIKFSNYGKSLVFPPKNFIIRFLIVTLLVTIIGAIADQLLVIKPLYDFSRGKYYSNYTPDFTVNYLLIIVALGIILLSVVLFYIFVMKMKIKYSFIIGLGMVCINIIFWYGLVNLYTNESYIIPFVFFFIVIIPLGIIFLASIFTSITKIS